MYKNTVLLIRPVFLVLFLFLGAGVPGCGSSGEKSAEQAWSGLSDEGSGMTVEELMRSPKIDAHAHFMALAEEDEEKFIAKLGEHNISWLTLCTVGTNWADLQKQISLAERLHSRYPNRVSWATSFNLENWGSPDWEKEAIKTIADGIEKGALAVKVWKEFGMVLKDPGGSFVMIDDPRLDPVFDYIEAQGLTLAAHIGEPVTCWQPVDSMSNQAARDYYRKNPQYHGYLHPEVPGYWEQVLTRDRMLEKHPGMRVVGSHLGSLEWDVDELAKRLDRYPNFAVDMGARIYNLQEQEREKVRNFIIKYQDRLLYGTDLVAGWGEKGVAGDIEQLDKTYLSDCRYFATDEEIEVPQISESAHVRGLALPANVLKKIFYENARKWFPGI